MVIGGGVNGAGIARDAAGRGLATLLAERGDLASATSSASSKLLHGGLRYLEQYEFRLVAEALAEREILLRVAGHLAWPLRFVIPHVPELRPRWMIRLGLFLYDHLARRSVLPASQAVRLDTPPYSSGLQPRLKHAFILQNDDRRVVFLIPYEEEFTLVGTTDVPVSEAQSAQPGEDEVRYLCAAAGRYLARRIDAAQVRWRYAGVRPLYDDGAANPSAITRDYTLRLDDDAGAAPVLSVFGGKITTYRRLAEQALAKLEPYFAGLKGTWTADQPLPGSNFATRAAARQEVFERYRALPETVVRGAFRRHGAETPAVLGDGRLGEDYRARLSERQVGHFLGHEFANSAEDVLWRRTKCGLHMTEAQRQPVAPGIGRWGRPPGPPARGGARGFSSSV